MNIIKEKIRFSLNEIIMRDIITGNLIGKCKERAALENKGFILTSRFCFFVKK